MSQTLQDLPDPLQPTPALPSSSPDDLLAKMADEAIDRLMADADKGALPPPSTEAEQDAADAVDAATYDMPLSEKRAPAPAEAEPVAAEAAETPVDAGPVDAELADTGGVSAPASPDAETPPPPPADVRALLRGEVVRPSPLLWPLRVLNAPFAWVGDRARLFMGLLAMVTFVPAVCAIVWKLWIKGH